MSLYRLYDVLYIALVVTDLVLIAAVLARDFGLFGAVDTDCAAMPEQDALSVLMKVQPFGCSPPTIFSHYKLPMEHPWDWWQSGSYEFRGLGRMPEWTADRTPRAAL